MAGDCQLGDDCGQAHPLETRALRLEHQLRQRQAGAICSNYMAGPSSQRFTLSQLGARSLLLRNLPRKRRLPGSSWRRGVRSKKQTTQVLLALAGRSSPTRGGRITREAYSSSWRRSIRRVGVSSIYNWKELPYMIDLGVMTQTNNKVSRRPAGMERRS